MKHIHILGICGTFMGGLAVLAKHMGYRVTGSDENVYPPMSTYLEAQGIDVWSGYDPKHFDTEPDEIIVGNTMKRGNPCIEFLLSHQLSFTSGPEWLAREVLKKKWVLCVTGTHGKTTTTSMLAWILESAGLNPSFLIGGIAKNFDCSSRLKDSDYFVIEGDEYDTAFFDKRSKFIHYFPRTVILNNLEYDHADIFESLDAIKKQFNHLMRIVPADGLVIRNADDANLTSTVALGCWTPQHTFGSQSADWSFTLDVQDGSEFTVRYQQQTVQVKWSLLGIHNVYNALAAMAAAHHVGISLADSAAALKTFAGVKRRLELRGEVKGVKVYDDFAHHPTAIATTLEGIKRHTKGRIIAVLEPRSNTMRLGTHREHLAHSVRAADRVWIFEPPKLGWDMKSVFASSTAPTTVLDSVEQLVTEIVRDARTGDSIVVMSNGGFQNVHQRLLDAMTTKFSEAVNA